MPVHFHRFQLILPEAHRIDLIHRDGAPADLTRTAARYGITSDGVW
jgi:hypothetical protein